VDEDDLPTLEEVRDAVKQLKHKKASGEDGKPAELLQIGSVVLEDLLHKLIVLIW
jgi:glutaredoxin-related protein